MTCTLYETHALAVRLSAPDVMMRSIDALEAHRANCQDCRRDQEQARAEYRKVVPAAWRTIAVTDPCPDAAHEWRRLIDDVEGCVKCGVVRW